MAWLVAVVTVLLLTIWLLPKLWRGVRRVISTARQLLGLAA